MSTRFQGQGPYNNTSPHQRTTQLKALPQGSSPKGPPKLSHLQRGLAGFITVLLIGGAIILFIRGGSSNANPTPGVTPPAVKTSTVARSSVSKPTVAATLTVVPVIGPAGDMDIPRGIPFNTPTDAKVIEDYTETTNCESQLMKTVGAIVFGFPNGKNALGTEVIATHSGVVKLLTNDKTYGNLVYVVGTHYTTTYGHLHSFKVKEGDYVTRGKVIGLLGQTGNVDAPALDYQVWDVSDSNNHVNKDPAQFCDCAKKATCTP